MTEDTDDFFMEVEKEILKDFLELFRDNYEKTNIATHFLEQNEGVSNAQGIANIRDSLSHFTSALQPNSTFTQRREHVTSAEEHLRRAIIEPYERAVNHKLTKFHALNADYRRDVIPLISRDSRYVNAPEESRITAVLDEVKAFLSRARNTKGKSFRDPDWQEGVLGLIEGYNLLVNLSDSVEKYWNEYSYNRNEELRAYESRKQTWIALWSITITAIACLVTVALAIVTTALTVVLDIF